MKNDPTQCPWCKDELFVKIETELVGSPATLLNVDRFSEIWFYCGLRLRARCLHRYCKKPLWWYPAGKRYKVTKNIQGSRAEQAK